MFGSLFYLNNDNLLHDPFQGVDRLGLATSQFGPVFLGRAHFVLGEWQGNGQEALYPEQVIGILRVAKVERRFFWGETCRSQKIN